MPARSSGTATTSHFTDMRTYPQSGAHGRDHHVRGGPPPEHPRAGAIVLRLSGMRCVLSSPGAALRSLLSHYRRCLPFACLCLLGWSRFSCFRLVGWSCFPSMVAAVTVPDPLTIESIKASASAVSMRYE